MRIINHGLDLNYKVRNCACADVFLFFLSFAYIDLKLLTQLPFCSGNNFAGWVCSFHTKLYGNCTSTLLLLLLFLTRPPMERRLNWIPDPAPTPPSNHGKENHPPPAEPRKLPQKMRPRRKRKEHHHHLGASGSAPGTSQPPRCSMSVSVKHPQPPQLSQYPQPSRSAANHNSARPDLLDQTELSRLYKPACPSLIKDTTTRCRRDNFSGSNLSFNCSQRSHQDYFSGSPWRALNKNWHMTDPLREASSVARIAVRESPDPAQTPPCAALPDVALDVGAEPPAAAATSTFHMRTTLQ